jgi:hypothetical protein
MMKRNKSRFTIASAMAAILFSVSACTGNFEEINSTGVPTEELAQGDFFNIGMHFRALQTNIIVLSTTNAYQFNESLAGQPYARYLTITKNAWNINNFCVFNASNDWLNALFTDQMTKVYSAWFELKDLNEDGQLAPFAWAWAEILRVAAVQRTTDMYGPIPYSKIKENDGSLTVPYDSQEEVYTGLFEDLEAAIDELKNYLAGGAVVSALADYDMIYEGDFSNWLRFANSLKLRMAIRIAFADPVKARQLALEALNPDNGGVIESIDQNATILNGNNPLYVVAGAYADCRAAAELTSYMNGYNDPRIGKYFKPVAKGANAGKYAGLRVGIEISSHTWACDNFSLPNVAEQDPVVLFTAAEVAFLKAEAAAYHNWPLPIPGTAEEFYNEGIRLSFSQWGASGVDSYLADNTSVPAPYSDDENYPSVSPSPITIKWNDAANAEQKLERVIIQKWIALYPLGLEGWSDQRRTGYPRFFTVPVNRSSERSLDTRGASRIPYAPTEKETNTANYHTAVQQYLGGLDGYGVRLWWDKKTNKPGW